MLFGQKNAVVKGLLLLGIPVFGSVMALCSRSFISKARQSEAKTNLTSVSTFQKNYYYEFKKYSASFSELGFQPEGNVRYKVYLSQEEMPSDIREKVREEHLPFVSNDHFRAIAITNDTDDCWMISDSGHLEECELK